MDNERIREICLSLPHTAETLNWGHHLVYWVGDRDLGGKMFAMTDVDGMGSSVLWFHCGAERFHELLENEGVFAAPHLARAHWVALERWDALPVRQIEDELRRAHALILAKLPKRTQAVLALPKKELSRLLSERRKKLAAQGKTRSTDAFGKTAKKEKD
jgi:predicted DNA-binding protein (MmcQ/YjbR family)